MPTKALILIDFQKEWIDPVSPDYLGDLTSLLARSNQLIDHCRAQGYKIIFTRHVEKDAAGQEQWAESSTGTQLMDGIHREPSDLLITKHKINPFYETSMAEELKGIPDLVVCGVLTNNCVRSFVSDAYDRGFNITVVKDCCETVDQETQEFTFKDLGSTREEIAFVDLSKFL